VSLGDGAPAGDEEDLDAVAAAERSDACPLPLSHDRISEAHWFLHQMLEHYHHPDVFRYSANAFLSALKSATVMLRLDLERAGRNEWRQEKFAPLLADPLFAAFSKGRDIVLHQSSLINGSRVELGLFKYYKVKMALQRDLRTDEPSHSLLARVVHQNAERGGFFVPVEHPWIGEQLGVRRMYYEPKLSPDLDVVTASHEAWLKVRRLVGEAHELLGRTFDDPGEEASGAHSVENVANYLETDADPSLVEQWGWN
jgi:hypothetical protein